MNILKNVMCGFSTLYLTLSPRDALRLIDTSPRRFLIIFSSCCSARTTFRIIAEWNFRFFLYLLSPASLIFPFSPAVFGPTSSYADAQKSQFIVFYFVESVRINGMNQSEIKREDAKTIIS